MTKISRRTFNTLAVATSASGLLAACQPVGKAHVVIVGGGFGGATTARYLKRLDPTINVTLIEPSKVFYTCPFSNMVIGGFMQLNKIGHTYANLRQAGVNVVHDKVTVVDPTKRTVMTASGKALSYDRLVVSPGIDFKFEDHEGYDQATTNIIPHAWKAGNQTMLLRGQLEAMPDGGIFAICPPKNPFRCPPGPYERVSMVASYFRAHKPRSKILVLDPKEKFSKQALFEEGWAANFPGMISHLKGADGKVTMVDAKNKILETEFGDRHKAHVINFIPNQKAGAIAHESGLTNGGDWCEVDQLTWESKTIPNVHVIGDAAIASPLPKSGYAANSQGKACAAAIIALLNGKAPVAPSYINTCYSLVTPTYGISVAMVYDMKDGAVHKVEGAGGVSPMGANAIFRRKEAKYASSWYENITNDIWDGAPVG